MDLIFDQLNTEQQNAVGATEGPITVLAGAGSGKTRILVYKVLYLIMEKKIRADNILLLTFTNKAANEMKERIEKALQENKISATIPYAGTFHSLCARILRRHGPKIGFSHNFRIYDEADQQETIKDALNSLGISLKEVKPRGVLSAISGAKNQMVGPAQYASIARGYFAEIVAKAYPVYQDLLRARDAVDFDDLMLLVIELLHQNPDVLSYYQDQFQYVLVDEYQDTNAAQYELTKLLGGKFRNICVVGDFSQSIYSFRGADFRNLEKFRQDFPDAKVFPLSQNYRSTQKILDAAHAVISRNTTHPVLSLWTENNHGEEITIFQVETEHQEVEYIIGKILEETRKNPQLKLSDVGVLYRTNAQSRTIEEVLLHHGIPYVLVGGTRFYERREIKDVLAMLSFLANSRDAVSMARIEKIGKRRTADFLKYFTEFTDKNFIESKPTIEILDEVVAATRYLEIYDEDDPEDAERLENIRELRSVAIEFSDLVQFLENVSLVEQDRQGAAASMPDKARGRPNAITLMTLHAAKGLEFKMVFMVGMEEGLFPHAQSLLSNNEIEEERRLAYVGITRAREKLFLTFAKRRLIYGQRISPMVSRFIMELPKSALSHNFESYSFDEPDFL